MSLTVGQLNFWGREVQAVAILVPGLGEMAYVVEEGDDLPEPGDEVECTVRYKIGPAHIGANHDKDGVAKDQFGILLPFQGMKPGFRITAVRKYADMEKAWEQDHGATG